MWKKLSSKKLEKRRYKRAKDLALYSSILIPGFIAIVEKIGYSRYRTDLKPLSWGELLSQTPLYLFGGFIIYFLVFKILNKRRVNPQRFCTKCEETYRDNSKQVCKCGGEVDFLEDFEYDENKKRH